MTSPKSERGATYMSNQDLKSASKMASMLGYDMYADILASTITCLDTPANVGIFAGWGSGKSYLMKKIRDVLIEKSRRYPITKGRPLLCIWMLWRLIFFDPPEALKRSNEVRFIPAYFNALEYAGSDHLWAGLVTRLVGAVEMGIGILPSAIFRAKHPPRMKLECYTSSKRDKIRFTPKTLCGSKIPVYSVFIFIILAAFGCGISLLSFAFNRQAYLLEEYEKDLNGTVGTAPPSLGNNKTIHPLAIGSIILSVPIVAFLKDTLPVILKIINSQKAHIQKILSKPDFSKELGVMAKIKDEIKHLSRLVHFMELFEQRRIVIAIFIDDLDKLPQQNIAPLLQAIKILLSDPNSRFVSIIAIDPYSVSDALEMGIQSEFPAINISGHKFLKQMIQVPFSIPAMSAEEKSHLFGMIAKRDRLSRSDVAIDVDNIEEVDGPLRTISKDNIAGSNNLVNEANTPLLKRKSKSSVNEKPEEFIAMEEIPESSINKPLYQQDIVEACDAVLHELCNSELFRFVKNNFQEMQRLVGIVKVTTRIIFCRKDQQKQLFSASEYKDLDESFDFPPFNLAAWVVLVGQWPYRTTWILQQVDDRKDAGSPYDVSTSLYDVYKDVEYNFTLVPGWRKLIQLDGDPEHLEEFLKSNESWLNRGFLQKLLPYTISLDRSLKSIVSWTSVERDLKSQGVLPSRPLINMDVNDVILLINAACKGSTRLDEYAQRCIEHNICGPVLLRGDIQEIKKHMDMSLGDWTQFSHAFLQLRAVHRFKFPH
uniref:NTPase KAP family P-loop domain-containing protein 1-like n=1 Tax=Styela clava TaxID=7725 RepID=UPI001939D8B8|nr:NTPase KAP family P-loop domain-containing protein 1-like [Styela clava]XP_039274635.1 NTPase KAP family P-loop domain-containing protein 1-like [Styela clava]